MKFLARKQGLWCQGAYDRMQLINPPPTVLPMKLVKDEFHQFQFKEDYFNSMTRIRRGTIYQEETTRGTRFGAFSFFPYSSPSNGADVDELYSVASYKFHVGTEVILGSEDSTSHWIIVLEERSPPDAYYLTLKSKSYLGVLPDIILERLPMSSKEHVITCLETVTSSAPFGEPQPVIDACRNAAIAMILAHYGLDVKNKELAEIVKKLDERDKGSCVQSAANIINRLHTRTKLSGREKHNLRPPAQRDADLAVDAIAFLLLEFGWAV